MRLTSLAYVRPLDSRRRSRTMRSGLFALALMLAIAGSASAQEFTTDHELADRASEFSQALEDGRSGRLWEMASPKLRDASGEDSNALTERLRAIAPADAKA